MFRFIALSNLLSYLSLMAALLAVHFALQNHLNLVGAMLSISALLDNYDGAFAGLFKRDEPQKAFGKELDSFIDCIAFGIVPVVCLRVLVYPSHIASRVAFAAAAFFFIVAAVTRLGAFNIYNREGREGFIGLPTTEATLLLATSLLFPVPQNWVWMYLIIPAVLMLVPVKVKKPTGFVRIFLAIWFAVVIGAHFLLYILRN